MVEGVNLFRDRDVGMVAKDDDGRWDHSTFRVDLIKIWYIPLTVAAGLSCNEGTE